VLTAVFRDSRLAGFIVPAALIKIVASWVASITPLYADTRCALTASGVCRRGARHPITRNRRGLFLCYCETPLSAGR
jgi:hypothetical protein